MSAIYDYDEERRFPFENCTWEWDEEENCLKFNREEVEEKELEDEASVPSSEFVLINEDIDVLEQYRFTKRYRRRVNEGEPDVVRLQDIKDVVLYTAPNKILNVKLITLIHEAAFDRFLRSLIIYIRYFIQIYDVMKFRTAQCKTKIRTEHTLQIELQWSQNLSEIRAVLAKEYFYLIFEDHVHYKRPKTLLINVETLLMESFLRLVLQMVWIAMNRTNFQIIECEINRMFRSNTFNMSLHRPDQHLPVFSEEERHTLYGTYHKSKRNKLLFGSERFKKNIYKTSSPAAEALLYFEGDIRVMGIFQVEFLERDTRISFLENLFCAPEETFAIKGISIGILGFDRKIFNALLIPIKKAALYSSVGTSQASTEKSLAYGDIDIPKPSSRQIDNLKFTKINSAITQRPPNDAQRKKWIKRYISRTRLRRLTC